MGKASTQNATPPPLRALGGWPKADWFCASVLLDRDVVGFTLPKLPGSRKQNFSLVERSVPQGAPASRTPKRVPSRIGGILDGVEAIRAAAFRRTTFLFESAPCLYFAELPLSRLKIRAADQLRRTLIENEWRACILGLDGPTATAMFWPAAEVEIARFVSAAEPPFPLHVQFAEAAVPAGPVPKRSPASDGAARRDSDRDRRLQDERRQLIQELAELRTRIIELQQSQSVTGAMETLGLDDARLKSMLRLLHPDKHGNSEAANEAAKWVNNLRDVLKESKETSGHC